MHIYANANINAAIGKINTREKNAKISAKNDNGLLIFLKIIKF